MLDRLPRNLLFQILALLLSVATVRANATRDVLAHSSGDWAWFAHVVPAKFANSLDSQTFTEQTEIFVRHNEPGGQWRPLRTIGGRASALASRMSQLVVLMSDGQWSTVWAEDSASGQPLPAGARIKALADDGTDLWAIGDVNGGMVIAQEAILLDIASTLPATMPVLPTAATEPTTPLSPAPVLFHSIDGRWSAVCELPIELTDIRSDEMTLTIINEAPLICYKTADGRLRTIQRNGKGAWLQLNTVKPAATQPASFRLLSDGFKPILWVPTANSPGELFADLQHGDGNSIKMQWNAGPLLDGTPATTFAGSYLCVFGTHGDKIIEGRFKPSGEAVGSPAELMISENAEGLLPHWLEAVLLAFMGFSVGARVFRQWLSDELPEEEEEPPLPAPLAPRFFAGALDALPVLAAVGFVLWKNNHAVDGLFMPGMTMFIVISSSVAVYLLHTTVLETITGRTAGKWLMGLKVVTVGGKPPTRGQLVLRNLLRIVDPVVMVLFSPLRQRDADTVANTMVVLTNAKPADSDQMTDQSDVR